MSCISRQICRILLEKDTKESLEYIADVWPAEEEGSRLAAVADTVRVIYGGEVGEIVASYIFVHYFRPPYKRVDCSVWRTRHRRASGGGPWLLSEFSGCGGKIAFKIPIRYTRADTANPIRRKTGVHLCGHKGENTCGQTLSCVRSAGVEPLRRH